MATGLVMVKLAMWSVEGKSKVKGRNGINEETSGGSADGAASGETIVSSKVGRARGIGSRVDGASIDETIASSKVGRARGSTKVISGTWLAAIFLTRSFN
jgi:hypothetical protein